MRTHTPRVRNTVAKRVISELHQARVDVMTLLKESGLTKVQVESEDGWVSYDAYADIYAAYCVFVASLHWLAGSGMDRECLLSRVNYNFDAREAHMKESVN